MLDNFFFIVIKRVLTMKSNSPICQKYCREGRRDRCTVNTYINQIDNKL